MGAHPGYTYRLRDDVAARAIEELDASTERKREFFRAVREWADDLADELDLIGWAIDRRGWSGTRIPVPFDPDEHENMGTDDEQPHVLDIQVYQRSHGRLYLGELRGLPSIHPDDYPGEDKNWPDERRSLVPEGWYRYKADNEVKVHKGGRTKAAEAARKRAASIMELSPRHPRDIVMGVATIPQSFLRYPGLNVGKDVVVMNSKVELEVADGDRKNEHGHQVYRLATEGDPVFPIPLSEYHRLNAQIAAEREGSDAA